MNRPTRRDIIRLTGAAAGAMLLGKFSLAAETKDENFTFVFITDTHLGRNGEEPSAQFKTAIEEINASPAEFIIHCGDLVNAGEKPENEKRYPEWLKLAGDFKKPWYAVPGNHDPDAMFTKHINKQMDVIIDRAPFRFICFRDALPNPEHHGVVTAEQIKWLQSHIDDATKENRKVILVAHVIYHDSKSPDRGWRIVQGREDFAKLLEKNHDTIVAFFAGHYHNGLRGWSDTNGIHEVILPSNCWNADPHAQNAGGYILDEFRPGYVLVEASARRLMLTYKPLGEKPAVSKELTIA
jgi:predicted phosphodiesterase